MKNSISLLIGSYTHTPNATGSGLCIAKFDPNSGNLEGCYQNPSLINPSYSAIGAYGIIYTASEVMDGPGSVTAFLLKDETLTPKWTASSEGRATCHVAIHPTKDLVGVTSYLEGSAKLFRASDGQAIATYRYDGKGPNVKRQLSSHPHQILFSPSGRWMLVNDLGSDKAWIHDLEEPESLEHPDAIDFPAGAGPRHSLFSNDGKDIYSLAELDGRLHHGKWNEANATCSWVDAHSVLPPEADLAPQCSAVQLHPRLPLIYTADRPTETISVFTRHPDGEIEHKAHFSTGGAGPRDFIITPNGDWLLVACQTANLIVAHELSPETGLPTGTTKTNQFGSPVNILALDNS